MPDLHGCGVSSFYRVLCTTRDAYSHVLPDGVGVLADVISFTDTSVSTQADYVSEDW